MHWPHFFGWLGPPSRQQRGPTPYLRRRRLGIDRPGLRPPSAGQRQRLPQERDHVGSTPVRSNNTEGEARVQGKRRENGDTYVSGGCGVHRWRRSPRPLRGVSRSLTLSCCDLNMPFWGEPLEWKIPTRLLPFHHCCSSATAGACVRFPVSCLRTKRRWSGPAA